MTATQDGAEIQARLRAAILRGLVARGKKPEIEVVGQIGGADVRIGMQNGKPTLSASKTWNF